MTACKLSGGCVLGLGFWIFVFSLSLFRHVTAGERNEVVGICSVDDVGFGVGRHDLLGGLGSDDAASVGNAHRFCACHKGREDFAECVGILQIQTAQTVEFSRRRGASREVGKEGSGVGLFGEGGEGDGRFAYSIAIEAKTNGRELVAVQEDEEGLLPAVWRFSELAVRSDDGTPSLNL